MVRRLIRRFLSWVYLAEANLPAVQGSKGEPERDGCGFRCHPDVAADRDAPVAPGDQPAPASSPIEHVLAVPVGRIREREIAILGALQGAAILPDLACILALRAVHDRLTKQNAEQGWLLDRDPAGDPRGH